MSLYMSWKKMVFFCEHDRYILSINESGCSPVQNVRGKLSCNGWTFGVECNLHFFNPNVFCAYIIYSNPRTFNLISTFYRNVARIIIVFYNIMFTLLQTIFYLLNICCFVLVSMLVIFYCILSLFITGKVYIFKYTIIF